jgi:hypothetical protein
MEEADRLADDIIVMSAGRVVASGTPLQLKARHGVGYSLTVVLSQQAGGGGAGGSGGGGTGSGGKPRGPPPGQAAPKAAAGAEAGTGADGAGAAAGGGGGAGPGAEGPGGAVAALVAGRVPGARLVSMAGCEVAMQLPREGSSGFPQVRRSGWPGGSETWGSLLVVTASLRASLRVGALHSRGLHCLSQWRQGCRSGSLPLSASPRYGPVTHALGCPMPPLPWP